jgi:putative membrane protein
LYLGAYFSDNGLREVIFLSLLIALVVNVAALMATAYLLPGFDIDNWTTAIVAAIILGAVNTFIRPIFLFLTAPLNLLTLGLFTFVVNAIMLWLVTLIVPGFVINGVLNAVIAAIVLAVISTILSHLLKDVGRLR